MQTMMAKATARIFTLRGGGMVALVKLTTKIQYLVSFLLTKNESDGRVMRKDGGWPFNVTFPVIIHPL